MLSGARQALVCLLHHKHISGAVLCYGNKCLQLDLLQVLVDKNPAIKTVVNKVGILHCLHDLAMFVSTWLILPFCTDLSGWVLHWEQPYGLVTCDFIGLADNMC